jgi:hypothetical protein
MGLSPFCSGEIFLLLVLCAMKLVTREIVRTSLADFLLIPPRSFLFQIHAAPFSYPERAFSASDVSRLPFAGMGWADLTVIGR